jgi:hypothetical protein
MRTSATVAEWTVKNARGACGPALVVATPLVLFMKSAWSGSD